MDQRLIDLAKEYRPTMDVEVVHAWANDICELVLELALSDNLCMSKGPRIGSEGVPVCERIKGHTGNCNGFPGSGFEDVFWVD